MEIRNSYNTPSFGMAFIKPSASVMDGFMKDVYGRKSIKMVNKALSDLVKREAKNPYDIYYRPATSDMGSAFGVKDNKTVVSEFAVNGAIHPTKFEAKMLEYDNEMAGAKSFIKRAFIVTKAIFSLSKELLRFKFGDKTDALPPALRKAVDLADKMNRELTKDAKRAEGIDKAWS